MEEKKKPIHEIQLPFNKALLKAAIWRHENGGKRARFSVSISRCHKQGDDGKWTTSSYLQRDDLMAVGHLSQLAHAWIIGNSERGDTENE